MVLVVSSLKKSFGSRVLWENIDLRAERGTLTGLIGASGSGKSTLLNCIGLLTAPDGGRISFDGVELLDMGSTRRRARRTSRSRCGAGRTPAACGRPWNPSGLPTG